MKKYLLLLIVSVAFLLLSAYSYVNAVSSNLADSVFRLHVIANSDSEKDQNLKYKVRDSLIEYMNTLTNEMNTKDEVIEIAKNHLEDFKNIAHNVVNENGYDYEVNVEIGNFSFPTKTYGDISFPAGFYDALRVKIGKAEGQNWWCVMFPPLCFVDVTSGVVPEESKENLEENLGDEEYSIISETDENGFTNIKFKIIEFFENIGTKLANN